MTTNMSVAELKSNLMAAIAKEHTTTATLLYYLAEYETRELHLRDGYSSLFKFLTEGHGYSEAAAARRCVAARFSKKYPEVLRMISSGDLSLSVIGMIARAEIKPEIIPTVLTAVKRKSKTQAEIILLQYTAIPAAPKKEKVKAVVVASAMPQKTLLDNCYDSVASSPSKDPVSDVFSPTDQVAKENHRAAASSSALAFQISLCLSEASMQKLKRAQELLGTIDLASTIEELAAFYNKKKDPLVETPAKTAEKTKKEKTTPPAECAVTENTESKKSRYIPAAMKRDLYRKAGGQCTYIDSESGKRCSETTHLEVDHVTPFAAGGETSTANLRVRCSAHNKLWAKDVYGAQFIKEKIRSSKPNQLKL